MTDTKFACPHCSQPLEAPVDMDGSEIFCPSCGKKIMIPYDSPPPLPHNHSNNHGTSSGQASRDPKHRGMVLGLIIASLVVEIIIVISVVNSSPPTKPKGFNTQGELGSTNLAVQVPARPQLDETPYIVPAANDIDVNLTFLRYIDFLSSTWPTPGKSQDVFEKQVALFRNKISVAQEYAERAHLDAEIITVLKEELAVLDKYVEMLNNIQKIDALAVARAEKEIAESSYKAGYAGGEAAAMAAQNDAGFAGSALTGIGVYLLGMFLQEGERSTVREQAYNSLVRAENSKFQSAVENYYSLFRQVGQTLSSRHGWQPGETGLNVPQDQIDQKNRATQNNDWASMASLLSAECNARPRDPFLFSQCAYYEVISLGVNATLSSLAEAQEKTLRAISLLPDESFYDEIKSYMYTQAGNFSISKLRQTTRRGYVNGPYDSNEAIRLFIAARKYNPYDSNGTIRMRLGSAYAYVGEFGKALQLFSEINNLMAGNSSFYYDYACICSAAKRVEDAWKMFHYCITKCGFAHVSWAKEDPDLASIRSAYSGQFADITSVKCRADIKWGILNDDVILYNDSVFPLYNVKFTPRISSNGNLFTKELRTRYLAPGHSVLWENVFSVPGSRYDTYNFSVVSDQGNASTN